MGTKNSVPVTSTQYQSESSSHHGPSAASLSSARSDSEASAPSGSFGKLSIGTIRPHAGAGSAADATVTPLDIKITNALKELKKKCAADKEVHHDPFTRIMLKFPLVAQAFNSVRSTFEELDKGKKGYIVYTDMEEAFERLGVDFSKEEMSQVFQESDMLENGQLTFKEFLVCLAIGFVLHKIPSLESHRLSIFYAPISPKDSKDKEKEKEKEKEAEASTTPKAILFGEGNKLRVAFQLAIDAFLWFDVDGNGQINRDEMASRLNSSTTLHSPTKKMSNHQREKPAVLCENSAPSSMNAEIWERRFNEMDWNHDGSIQFKEFLMAFESWVGLDDDEGSE